MSVLQPEQRGGSDGQLHRAPSLRTVEERKSRSVPKVQKWSVCERSGRVADGLLESAESFKLQQRDERRTVEGELMQRGKLPTMEMLC